MLRSLGIEPPFEQRVPVIVVDVFHTALQRGILHVDQAYNEACIGDADGNPGAHGA